MIGIRIKDLRKQKRISQTELGKLIHVSQQTITAWENGKAEPSSNAISQLADVFDVSADYLLGREVKQPANNNRNEKADLVAAHIDDDVSESDMKQITDFIDFLKSKQ